MADNSSGRLGEQYAAERMKNDGYEIICTNYRSRFGEIDIIASDSKYIVFVSVSYTHLDVYKRQN